MQYLLLIIGLVFTIKSADILIDSVSKIARAYGVSSFIIGITVVAFGTSAPELAVGIVSGISRTNQLTLGNIIGSSMSNTALIVGLSAIIFPLRVKDAVVKRELPILIVVQLALAAMLLHDARLSRLEGIILIGAFAVFIIFIIRGAGSSMKIRIDTEGDIDTDGNGNGLPARKPEQKNGLVKLWLLSAASLLGLIIGGKLTVDSSTLIAQGLGLSETLIGLTVVAIATTMPELITSIIAARKKEPDIVLGNCIGSNIFNILLVLGISSAIHQIRVADGLLFDFVSILLVTILVFIISVTRKQLQRPVGIVLFAAYAAYLTVKVFLALT